MDMKKLYTDFTSHVEKMTDEDIKESIRVAESNSIDTNDDQENREFAINNAHLEYEKHWKQEFAYDYGRLPYDHELVNWKAYDRYNKEKSRN